MYKFGSCLLVAIVLFLSLDSAVTQGLEDILQMGQDAYEKEKTKPDVKLPPQNSSYDFIIVGAGPAGCVLANRLTENPNWTVYLLEAGATENIVNEMPVLTAFNQLTPSNWMYQSTPQSKACFGMRNQTCNLPRGKMLGGTSGINFMIYNRGNREDFDMLGEMGIRGWSYDEVLPYFKRSERANLVGLENSPYHGRSGKLSVEDVKYRTGMAAAFVRGSEESGHPRVDYNGESQIGTSYVQATTDNGKRHTAAKAYLLPILETRKNLHVLPFATVTKILIDENFFACGVDFMHRNKKYTIKAKKEVILCAGTFNSAQLLMLSGVGPRDVLRRVGIKQLVDLPVGKIMYEHMSHFGPVYLTNSTGETLFSDRITASDISRYQAGDPSTRVSTLGGVEALTLAKVPNIRSEDNRPDTEIIFVSCSLASDYGTALKEGANFKDVIYQKYYKELEGREHLTLIQMPFHPISIGHMWLKNNNPFTAPVIEPNYFDREEDVEVMLESIKVAMRIAESPAMKKINATLFKKPIPGCERYRFGSDAYWKCSIRTMSYTLHHQVGSCKMGTPDDSTAVVDENLLVLDMFNLRVADCSVFPIPLTGHTNALSFMIGEKTADVIKRAYRNK